MTPLAGDTAAPPARDRGLSLPRLWALVAVAAPAIIALREPLATIDLTYHLRVGEIMLRTHHLVRTDTLTFTAGGRSWLNQQWLAQVILAAIHRAGGFPALVVACSVLVGSVFLFVFLACRAAGASAKVSAWLTLASFVVSLRVVLGLRPQLLAMVLFAATTWLVMGRRDHPGRLWIVPILTLLWANIHGSFFLAPVLLGLAFLQDRRDRISGADRMLLVVAAALLASLVNPFGLRVWGYVVGISMNPTIRRLVTEWQPPGIWTLAGGAFFLSGLAVALVLIRAVRHPVPWPTLLALAGLFGMGLFALRFVPWWAILAPSIVAGLLPRSEPAWAPGNPRLNATLAAGLVLVAILLLPWWRSTPASLSDASLTDAPVGLTSALMSRVAPGARIFNPQDLGSWFEFAVPRDLVFVDSRIELFPSRVWTDYLRVAGGQQGWQGTLDRWRVDTVVVEPSDALLRLIRTDVGWRQVYRDGDGAIFVRRT